VSKRLDALLAIKGRLAQIATSNGYETNAGALVFIGEVVIVGESDPDSALGIVIGDDSLGPQGERVVSSIPIEIQALVKVVDDQPLVTVESVIADIKKAVEQQDRTLGGLLINRGLERRQTKVAPRDPNIPYAAATVGYEMQMFEPWGAP
jgi:hypothetical protein